MSTKRDLILTIVERVGFDYIAPFVISLKRTGFRGKLVVFASAMKDAAVQQLQDQGITVVSYRFIHKRVREAFVWPFWPAWSRFFSKKGLPGIKEKLAHFVLPLIYRRYLFYQQFLRAHHSEFDRVFLSDARDVYFQADPFSWQPGAGLHFFLLAHGNTIQSEQISTNWTQNQFGCVDPEPYLNKGVACAGTTFGDVESIIRYLSQIISYSLRARRLRKIKVGDQGVHNFLIYENLLPMMTLHPNEGGPVLTAGSGMTMNDVLQDREGSVVDQHGKIIPILHQYDRIPDLKKHILVRLKAQSGRGGELILPGKESA